MNQRSTKTNLVRVKLTLEQILLLLADANEEVPQGLPTNVRLTFDDTLELVWEDVPAPSPF